MSLLPDRPGIHQPTEVGQVLSSLRVGEVECGVGDPLGGDVLT